MEQEVGTREEEKHSYRALSRNELGGRASSYREVAFAKTGREPELFGGLRKRVRRLGGKDASVS